MIRALNTYGALCAKTRALYGKRLRYSDYEHMASLRGEADLWAYLRQQPAWSAAMAQLGGFDGTYIGRVELESVLWDQIRAEYEALDHFVPRQDKTIMRFPVLLAEQRVILAVFRRMKAGHARGLAVSAKLLSSSRLDTGALERCRDYDGLLSACRETIYYPALLRLRPVEGRALPDYTAAETLLRSTYFSHMYRIIHQNYGGETQKVLLRSYGEQIDLLNIIHILRLKTFFPDMDDYFAVLFPFNYRLRPDVTRALCAASDAAGVFELLKTTPYAGSFADVNVTEVEDFYRRAFYAFNRRQLAAGKPSVYTAMAYLNMKEQELRVLINIIESVKYGVPFDSSYAKLVGQ